MTYFGVLARFLLPLLLLLIALHLWRPARREFYRIVLIHLIIALVYTTPWDNYLVATGVWWYDESLVTGLTIGWVPVEEYTFFILQTALTGLWIAWLMRHTTLVRDQIEGKPIIRWAASIVVITVWITFSALWLIGWTPGTYLSLILAWALIPILIQVAFGADILLANWQLLLAAIVPPTLYLWLVDFLAIQSGTWTIDPAQTTGIKVGVLPLEEMVFFLVTNVIVAFGVTLMLSETSQQRAGQIVDSLRRSRTLIEGNDHASI